MLGGPAVGGLAKGKAAVVSIEVQDYHKNYGETVAVAGIGFAVAPGEVLGLVGPNGAGKTTTLRALAGILTPTRGRLSVAGHDVLRDPIAAKLALACVPDDPKLFDQLTIWEHFRFIASAYRLTDWTAHAEVLLKQFELVEKRDALCSDLSRGMRQNRRRGCRSCRRHAADPRMIRFTQAFLEGRKVPQRDKEGVG